MFEAQASVATVSEIGLQKPRIGLICDFVEENWPSMDLVANMVFERLEQEHSSTLEVTRICPSLQQRFGRLPVDRAGARVSECRPPDESVRRLRPGPKAPSPRVRSLSFDRP